MKTLLKGGSVVSGSGVKRADVLMDGEKVLRVGRGLTDTADTVKDVSGCLLFPGFIDAHTHFDLDVAGTTTADDFYTGSRAALRGGTTTVIDFACPNKGETLHHGLELWHQKADGRTFCDYGFHMTIDDWNEGIRAELPDMFAQGVSSFKSGKTAASWAPAPIPSPGLPIWRRKRSAGCCASPRRRTARWSSSTSPTTRR